MTTDAQFANSMGVSSFASPLGLDRLVRKEVSLGSIREMLPPQDHIGTTICPWHEVESDDVIFDYIKDSLGVGLAPARAEDAESELARKDDLYGGQGRASIIDWAQKDKYTASDVSRYRDSLIIQQRLDGVSGLSGLNSVGRFVGDFQNRLARDDASRRRRLDNRIEWLIQEALWKGAITYADGKIKFSVNYGRPVDQQSVAVSTLWDAGVNHDPINDLLEKDQAFYNKYGVHYRRAITSQKVLNTLWKSAKFTPLSGMNTTSGGGPIDLNYLMSGSWSPQAAQRIVEEATGIKFEVYDSVYRTRAIGSTTTVNTRFSPENEILLLPDMSDLGEINDMEIGFAALLTSPHPEGNWAPGFYEWEDETKDPWMHVRGSGVKAFPVFPYLEYSSTLKVLA